MNLFPIETGNLKLDGGAMFGVVPKVLWQEQYPADENNLCNWAMRCLLIEDGDRLVLIDNGIGDKQDYKFLKHYYLNGDDTLESSLAKHGFRPEDVTDMILTHLHFDHCGGSIKYNDDNTSYELTFPNANYWVSKKQYEWATNPNHREGASFLKENIFPIEESGRLKLIDEEGELLPAATHIPMPWIMAYDTRPLITLDDKTRFYREAVPGDYILFFEHDIYNECCTLEQTEKGVRVKETFKLSEI